MCRVLLPTPLIRLFCLLNKYQSGFRSLHSPATALLDATNQWYFNIDNGLVTSVVFLDLAKAVDTIDQNINYANNFPPKIKVVDREIRSVSMRFLDNLGEFSSSVSEQVPDEREEKIK